MILCPNNGTTLITLSPFSPKSWSNADFSFQFIASYVWYSMENLAGDLLLGSNANFSFQFIASYVWYSMENLAGDLLLGSNANFSFQ